MVEKAATILAKHWTHNRHELSLRALGTMLNSDVDEEVAQAVVDRVMEMTGDEEAGDKLQRRPASYVAELLRKNRKVPGIPKLRERLGEDTDAFLKAVGIDDDETQVFPFAFRPLNADWIHKPPPPVEWVVEDWIIKDQVAVVAATTSVGKTNIAMITGSAVAMGRPVFGKKTTAGRVIALLMEDTRTRFIAASTSNGGRA
jgi:hypothetical protein